MSVTLVNAPSSVSAMQTQEKNVDAVKETVLFQKAINAVSADLYQHMSLARSNEHKNFVFFTPNLIASLSMLYAGAPKNLKNIMEQALHVGELKEGKWHSLFREWSTDIQNRGNPALQGSSLVKADQLRFKFQQTQIIAVDAGTPLTDSAINHLLKYNPVFASFKNPEEARTLINAKVEIVTEGKIKNLVEEVSDGLVLIMASAALFKGQWQYPFKKAENSEEVFYNSDNTIVRVEMMNQGLDNLRMAYDYNEDEKYSVEILELPFHGQISFLLIKPSAKPQKSAATLQKFMTQKNLQNLLDNFDERFSERSALTVGIPKVSLKDKTDLLSELGHTPWAQALKNADFNHSLVHAGAPARTPELVSEVHFNMDEEGAEVAAASYSPTYCESCDPDFKVRGPFGLAIVDCTTQTILGMGQVLKMEGEAVQKTW